MDTRSKIVSLREALSATSGKRTAIVSGYFDPLQVEHALRLREIRAGHECVVVLLTDPPAPVLDSFSRAQLVAALDMIDYVVLPQECASSAGFERYGTISVYREEAADEARLERLVRHVHDRHGAVAARS